MTTKPAAPQTTWTCLTCPETGTSDLGARKHEQATTHGTTTHMRAVSK